ncbi:MAG: cupin domain-containing protein [Polyangiaceae bacterium]|jgi:hypothetical protein|nr:cupin domain-containing protein [Polyangiaceae bacterium]
MHRQAPLPFVALGAASLGLASCPPPSPTPLDARALPTATTSAQPLFLSSEIDGAIAPADGDGLANPSAETVEPVLLDDLQARIDRTATCPTKHCFRAAVVPRPHETQLSATAPNPDLGRASPVAVWQEVMGPDVKLDFPRVKGLSLAGVVLRGVVTVSPAEGGALAALEPWRVFLAPGVGVTLRATPDAASVLLVAFAQHGPLEQRLAAAQRDNKASYWEKRPAPVVLRDLEGADDLSWASGHAHARVGLDAALSPQAYLGALVTYPKLSVANHQHEQSWEVLIPLRAHGSLVLTSAGQADGGGQAGAPREVPVSAGTVVTIPPGVQHAWKPGGDQRLIAIQLFLPSGPEQRYAKLAGQAPQPTAAPATEGPPP